MGLNFLINRGSDVGKLIDNVMLQTLKTLLKKCCKFFGRYWHKLR